MRFLKSIFKITQKNKSKIETEEKNMKKIISFSEAVKKHALHASTGLLAAFAVFFASAACFGHFYEPQVPKKLL